MSDAKTDHSLLPKLPKQDTGSQISLGPFDNTGMGDAILHHEPQNDNGTAQKPNVFQSNSGRIAALSSTAIENKNGSMEKDNEVNSISSHFKSKLNISSEKINPAQIEVNNLNKEETVVNNNLENKMNPTEKNEQSPPFLQNEENNIIRQKIINDIRKNKEKIEKNLEELEILDNYKNDDYCSEFVDGGAIGQIESKYDELRCAFKPLKKSIPIGPTPNAARYNMNHKNRGYCLIFNHRDFDPHTELGTRSGTDRDRDSIKQLFSFLGFDVKIFNNYKARDVMYEIHKFAYEIDHSDNDCIAIFFLSHGEDGIIYARDDQMDVEKMLNNFTGDNCSSLAGKPKMFFFQACRGKKVSDDVTLMHVHYSRDQTDGYGMYKIPVQADFLVCYSTISDQYSWRNTLNGSWFIQSICHVFRREAAFEDVLSMMTSVNRHMIVNFQSNCPSTPSMHNKKQSACIKTTATRKIYFTPKQ